MKVETSLDPGECSKALAGSCSPIIIDVETEGLHSYDRIVSIGLLIDNTAYIHFIRSMNGSIDNHKLQDVQQALSDLAKRPRGIIGHNIGYDLAKLAKDGITFHQESIIADTEQLLRLHDPDRGREQNDRRQPRRDRVNGDTLNYKLKPVALQLLKLKGALPDLAKGGGMALVNKEDHISYLRSDLILTRRLFDYLAEEVATDQAAYFFEQICPLHPLLLDMHRTGVTLDSISLEKQAALAAQQVQAIDNEHKQKYGCSIIMDEKARRAWYTEISGNPMWLKQWTNKRGKLVWSLSLGKPSIKENLVGKVADKYKHSLELIQEYQALSSTQKNLGILRKHKQHDGKIHSTFISRQATGRISATAPNLQSIPKGAIRETIVASPGHLFVGFDIAQADVRVLAHMIDSTKETGEDWITRINREMNRNLGYAKYKHQAEINAARNPHYDSSRKEVIFDPTSTCALFKSLLSEDFYSAVYKEVEGVDPPNKEERNRFKPIVLAILNGKGVQSLAKDLRCTIKEARGHLAKFEKTFSKMMAYKRYANLEIAKLGQARTFMGRVRPSTMQRWMVASKHPIEIFISYKKRDKLWLKIIPLSAAERTLKCKVLEVVDRNRGKLLFDHKRGLLINRRRFPYRFFEDYALATRLPIRNIPWKIIHRVRGNYDQNGIATEEGQYPGFDATSRSLFNTIMQGGTADIVRSMMLRIQPFCEGYKAKLLLQIHDELIFEVPEDFALSFANFALGVLVKPPSPDFRVPIKVEPKIGPSFGSLVPLKDFTYSKTLIP